MSLRPSVRAVATFCTASGQLPQNPFPKHPRPPSSDDYSLAAPRPMRAEENHPDATGPTRLCRSSWYSAVREILPPTTARDDDAHEERRDQLPYCVADTRDALLEHRQINTRSNMPTRARTPERAHAITAGGNSTG